LLTDQYDEISLGLHDKTHFDSNPHYEKYSQNWLHAILQGHTTYPSGKVNDPVKLYFNNLEKDLPNHIDLRTQVGYGSERYGKSLFQILFKANSLHPIRFFNYIIKFVRNPLNNTLEIKTVSFDRIKPSAWDKRLYQNLFKDIIECSKIFLEEAFVEGYRRAHRIVEGSKDFGQPISFDGVEEIIFMGRKDSPFSFVEDVHFVFSCTTMNYYQISDIAWRYLGNITYRNSNKKVDKNQTKFVVDLLNRNRTDIFRWVEMFM